MERYDATLLKAALESGSLSEEQALKCRKLYEKKIAAGGAVSVARLLVDEKMLPHKEVKKLQRALVKQGIYPRVGAFELIEHIGSGPLASVYRARDTRLDVVVALKRLNPQWQGRPDVTLGFFRSARAVVDLKHPNVVRVREVGKSGGTPYIAMEYLPSGNLTSLIEETKILRERRALELTRQAARGLAAMHAAGLLHGNLKPSNILITEAGAAKVSDPALARRGGGETTAAPPPGSTPVYCAPEQLKPAHACDERSDVYALGAVLFHMLTGTPPFEGTKAGEVKAQHDSGIRPDPKMYIASITDISRNLIFRMMAPSPSDRPQSMEAVVQEVAQGLNLLVDDPVSGAPAWTPSTRTAPSPEIPPAPPTEIEDARTTRRVRGMDARIAKVREFAADWSALVDFVERGRGSRDFTQADVKTMKVVSERIARDYAEVLPILAQPRVSEAVIEACRKRQLVEKVCHASRNELDRLMADMKTGTSKLKDLLNFLVLSRDEQAGKTTLAYGLSRAWGSRLGKAAALFVVGAIVVTIILIGIARQPEWLGGTQPPPARVPPPRPPARPSARPSAPSQPGAKDVATEPSQEAAPQLAENLDYRPLEASALFTGAREQGPNGEEILTYTRPSGRNKHTAFLWLDEPDLSRAEELRFAIRFRGGEIDTASVRLHDIDRRLSNALDLAPYYRTEPDEDGYREVRIPLSDFETGDWDMERVRVAFLDTEAADTEDEIGVSVRALAAGWQPEVAPDAKAPLPPALPPAEMPKLATDDAGRRWALLVGVDAYRSGGELTVSHNGAEALKSALEKGGYERVMLLVDAKGAAERQPTGANIRRGLEELAHLAGEGDTVLFFFSGHGVTRDGKAAVIPLDGSLDHGIAVKEICERLEASDAGLAVMMFDTCHFGSWPEVNGITARATRGLNTVVFLSCREGEISWKDDTCGYSVFVRALTEGLGGRAAGAEGQITLSALRDYVDERVRGWARSHHKPAPTPVLVGKFRGNEVLAECPEQMPALVEEPVTAPVDPRLPGPQDEGVPPRTREKILGPIVEIRDPAAGELAVISVDARIFTNRPERVKEGPSELRNATFLRRRVTDATTWLKSGQVAVTRPCYWVLALEMGRDGRYVVSTAERHALLDAGWERTRERLWTLDRFGKKRTWHLFRRKIPAGEVVCKAPVDITDARVLSIFVDLPQPTSSTDVNVEAGAFLRRPPP
jgi:serine/threonine-protein kinase